MNSITPFLWFNDNAEEAINYYVSIFNGYNGRTASIESINKYPDSVPNMGGKVLTAVVNLDGQTLMVLDGGPIYPQTEAFSLMVNCKDQEEVDYFWEKLTEGGQESQCGWLKDKFGLSWQIIPKQLGELMGNPNPVKSNNVMQAMLQMHKIDVKLLQEASDKE